MTAPKKSRAVRGAQTPAPKRARSGTVNRGREDILDAATREFADHGYAGATTAGIARRAKVTQPLVHHHFQSKRGLWNAVLEVLFSDLATQLGQATAKQSSRRRLEDLLRLLVRFSGRRPELGRLVRAESSAGGEPFEDLYDRWLSPWVQFFEKELQVAIEEGQARPFDARMLYFAVVGASTGPFAEPLTARRAFGLDLRSDEQIEAYADCVVDLLFGGLTPR
ncbi:MAG: TetR/AcrR family transcriptional regulator [Myxococcaceae bacterium]